jgi:hypothetical protein
VSDRQTFWKSVARTRKGMVRLHGIGSRRSLGRVDGDLQSFGLAWECRADWVGTVVEDVGDQSLRPVFPYCIADTII